MLNAAQFLSTAIYYVDDLETRLRIDKCRNDSIDDIFARKYMPTAKWRILRKISILYSRQRRVDRKYSNFIMSNIRFIPRGATLGQTLYHFTRIKMRQILNFCNPEVKKMFSIPESKSYQNILFELYSSQIDGCT